MWENFIHLEISKKKDDFPDRPSNCFPALGRLMASARRSLLHDAVMAWEGTLTVFVGRFSASLTFRSNTSNQSASIRSVATGQFQKLRIVEENAAIGALAIIIEEFYWKASGGAVEKCRRNGVTVLQRNPLRTPMMARCRSGCMWGTCLWEVVAHFGTSGENGGSTSFFYQHYTWRF